MTSENPFSAPTVDAKQSHPAGECHFRFRWIFLGWFSCFLLTLLSLILIVLIAGVIMVAIFISLDVPSKVAQGWFRLLAVVIGNIVPIPLSLYFYWVTVRRFVLKRLEFAEP